LKLGSLWESSFRNVTVRLAGQRLDDFNSPLGDAIRVAHMADSNKIMLATLQVPLRDMSNAHMAQGMDFVQADYYSNPGVFYAQGWSMVQFLMQSPDPARRELIPRLIKDFKDSKNFVKSTDKIFKKQDLAALDQEWIGWLLTLPLSDPLLTLAREFGDRLKPGSAALVLLVEHLWALGLQHTIRDAGGYPVLQHVRRLIDGPLVWAPGLEGAVVLSMRGGDFQLTVGQDFSVGYLDHDAQRVQLYIEESFTFWLQSPQAAVPLVFPAPPG